MSWIKSGNKRHEAIFIFFMSFVFILAGRFWIGVSLFLTAFFRISTAVTVVKPARTQTVPYAGFGLRLAGYLIDSSFIFFPSGILYFIAPNFMAQKLAFGILSLMVLFVQMAMLKRWGQTPGYMVMGLRMVRNDFTGLTWISIFLRMFFALLTQLWTITKFILIYEGVLTFSSFLIPSDGLKALEHHFTFLGAGWTLLGVLTFLSSRRKQTLNDYLGGTVVLADQKALVKTYQVIGGGLLVYGLFLGLFYSQLSSYYQTGARYGDPESERQLAELYLDGRSVPQDDALALQWFQKAADQGDDRAQCSLGRIYEKGLGVPADQSQAIQWYTQAAKNGNSAARSKLKALGIKPD